MWNCYTDLVCCIHSGLQIDSLLAMCTLRLAILSSFFELLWSLRFTSILYPWVLDNFMCKVHDTIYFWWLCLRCWPFFYSSHLRCHDHLVLRHLLMSLLDLVHNTLEEIWGDNPLFAKNSSWWPLFAPCWCNLCDCTSWCHILRLHILWFVLFGFTFKR